MPVLLFAAAAAAALAVFRFHVVIVQAAELAALALAVLAAARLALAAVRFARLPRPAKAHYPAALWARLRWRWLARNLGLAYEDKHRRARPMPAGTSATITERPQRRKLRYPRASFRADPYGLRVRVRTIPGTDRASVEKQADHLANAWRAHRVSVSQPRPGRLELRGFRTDPLTEPLSAASLPAFDGRNVTLGRDESGDMRPVSLANHSGSCWCGNPGRGKTEAGLSLACQLAASPAVEWYIADGGELDWAPFAAGAAAYVTELADFVAMLHDLDEGMTARRRTLESDLGVRNAWRVGPSAEYPLRWLLVEEAPAFLQPVKGNKKRADLAEEAHGLIAGLLRRGRAPMYHTSLLTQKATTTGGLHPDLRDLCGLRWSFGVATVDGAASILGADIREYPSLCPTQLQGPEHVGIASCLLPTHGAPFTLLRFPAVGEARADRVALDLAQRRSPQAVSAAPAVQLVPPLAADPETPLPAAAAAS